jgi:hypothetical protein
MENFTQRPESRRSTSLRAGETAEYFENLRRQGSGVFVDYVDNAGYHATR